MPNYDCWLSGQVVWSGIIFRKPVAGHITLAAESGGMEQSGEMRNASLSIVATTSVVPSIGKHKVCG